MSVIRRAAVADAAILGKLLAIAQVTDLRWERQPPAPPCCLASSAGAMRHALLIGALCRLSGSRLSSVA
jgi:hypothetical protein